MIKHIYAQYEDNHLPFKVMLTCNNGNSKTYAPKTDTPVNFPKLTYFSEKSTKKNKRLRYKRIKIGILKYHGICLHVLTCLYTTKLVHH